MSHSVVPVTMGSPAFHTKDVGPLRATEALFPPSAYLAPHVHERPIVAVILDGSWEELFAARSCECLPGTVLTEPAGERHANRFQQAGARVLVIEPDPALADLWRPCARLLGAAGAREDGWVAGLARRAAAELRAPDDAAPLALEGLAFEILAGAARSRLAAPAGWPAWLRTAQELLHDRALEPLRLTQLAGLLGVHPAHLARLFRARFGTSVGAYQRQLRLEWAGRRLVETRDTLAQIALDAGFADQSHFTRAFKRYAGVSPGRYRQTRARGNLR